MFGEFHFLHPGPLDIKNKSVMEWDVSLARMILINEKRLSFADSAHFDCGLFVLILYFMVGAMRKYEKAECQSYC